MNRSGSFLLPQGFDIVGVVGSGCLGLDPKLPGENPAVLLRKPSVPLASWPPHPTSLSPECSSSQGPEGMAYTRPSATLHHPC